jgi:NAD-dependent DNA ligase
MADHKGDAFYNRVGGERIASRQIDELLGLCRGLAADGVISQPEVEFLQVWLAANREISDQPLIHTLYDRIASIMADGVASKEECEELLATLRDLTRTDVELGEVLKATSLPLCDPAPALAFPGRRYCFTGTFAFGKRKQCEGAIIDRAGLVGTLTQKTDVLVVGIYATESWKHSSFGNKILQAVEWRAAGLPIAIVSESHWRAHL